MKCWYQFIILFGKWSKKPISKMFKINKNSCINHGRFIHFLMFLKLMFLFIFPRAFQLKCSDFSSLNECVGYRWNRNINTSYPWENEQKHRFQKHQKLNKSSMVDTWVFVDFGHFWNWFLWSFSECISTKGQRNQFQKCSKSTKMF